MHRTVVQWATARDGGWRNGNRVPRVEGYGCDGVAIREQASGGSETLGPVDGHKNRGPGVPWSKSPPDSTQQWRGGNRTYDDSDKAREESR